MDSGVTRTRISSHRGKFQWTLDQVKWNLVRVSGNLSYPSRNDWQVGWNPNRIIGEFNLSEFELSGFYHSNKMGWNFCLRKDISLNFRQVRTPLRQIRKAARKTLCWLRISLNTTQLFCLNQPQLSELSCKPTK